MRKVLISICFILMMSVCFAIPGVENVFPITSGEYVYYRDYSFSTETYIGFLQYDESTIAVRYYAKNPEMGSDDITLYITLDSTKNYIHMTGEKIVGANSSEDTETLNYLHDIIYEFSARRKRINYSDFSSTLRVNEEYVQFGGNVTMVYDYYVPVFNLNRILDEKGNVVFEAIAIGSLYSSEDTSFQSFKGYENFPNVNATDQKVDLSNKWEKIYDISVIGDDVIMADFYMEYENLPENWFESIVASSFLQIQGGMVYVPSVNITKEGNKYIVKQLYYTDLEKFYGFSIDIYEKIESNYVKMTSITSFGDFYYSNKSYFDGLAK